MAGHELPNFACLINNLFKNQMEKDLLVLFGQLETQKEKEQQKLKNCNDEHHREKRLQIREASGPDSTIANSNGSTPSDLYQEYREKEDGLTNYAHKLVVHEFNKSFCNALSSFKAPSVTIVEESSDEEKLQNDPFYKSLQLLIKTEMKNEFEKQGYNVNEDELENSVDDGKLTINGQLNGKLAIEAERDEEPAKILGLNVPLAIESDVIEKLKKVRSISSTVTVETTDSVTDVGGFNNGFEQASESDMNVTKVHSVFAQLEIVSEDNKKNPKILRSQLSIITEVDEESDTVKHMKSHAIESDNNSKIARVNPLYSQMVSEVKEADSQIQNLENQFELETESVETIDESKTVDSLLTIAPTTEREIKPKTESEKKSEPGKKLCTSPIIKSCKKEKPLHPEFKHCTFKDFPDDQKEDYKGYQELIEKTIQLRNCKLQKSCKLLNKRLMLLEHKTIIMLRELYRECKLSEKKQQIGSLAKLFEDSKNLNNQQIAINQKNAYPEKKISMSFQIDTHQWPKAAFESGSFTLVDEKYYTTLPKSTISSIVPKEGNTSQDWKKLMEEAEATEERKTHISAQELEKKFKRYMKKFDNRDGDDFKPGLLYSRKIKKDVLND